MQISPQYVPGMSSSFLAQNFNIDAQSIIKLGSNESPLGPSKHAIQAAKSSVENGHIYPDSNAFTLRNLLSEKYHVNDAQFTFGPGSESVLNLIGNYFLLPGDEVIISEYSFIVYDVIARTNHARIVKVPSVNFGVDLDSMAKACNSKTRMIFVANPNNPTGTWFKHYELIRFMRKVPSNVIVVIDEAYFEFLNNVVEYPDTISLLRKYPNLIITRTFSKAYSLAGFRIGYSISSREYADEFNKIRMPFNFSAPAVSAATAALQDQEHLERVIKCVITGKRQLERGFSKLNLEYIPASANFIMVKFGSNTQDVYEFLLKNHIIVRPLDNYGLGQYLRITIGNKQANMKLLIALERYIQSSYVSI